VAAEFILTFNDVKWYSENRDSVREKIISLGTFSIESDAAYELLGREKGGGWRYDVRLFLREMNIFIEISNHPPSVEADLSLLFGWIRQQTMISICDEDGEDSGW
jgi:hypothetical protein